MARDRQENETETEVLSALGADSFADANWPFGDADADFIVAVVEDLETSHDLDAARIFVAGLQNGAYMATRMICDHPERFAAAAQLGAGPFVAQECPASRALPSFSVISDASLDKVATYASGWAKRNACRDAPETRLLAPDVEELAYVGCPEEAEVVLHVLSGVAYPWPWPPSTSSMRFDDYWPARAIWEFLSAHPCLDAMLANPEPSPRLLGEEMAAPRRTRNTGSDERGSLGSESYAARERGRSAAARPAGAVPGATRGRAGLCELGTGVEAVRGRPHEAI